jgi:Dynamin family
MTVNYSEQLKKVSIRDLQNDVIGLLEKIESLMGRASNALKSDGTGKKYAEFARQIVSKKHDVEELELVMSIIAPMKAGKSTIINAVVGFDLLPSRAAAMTTLPTEIVFKKDLIEPLLIVPKDCSEAFNKTVEAIKEKIRAEGIAATQERIVTHPHLQELLQEVEAIDGFFNSEQVKGTDEIKRILTALNDIVRLASILEPTKDPLSRIKDLPRIETPFWRSPKQEDQANLLGSLVIVDTPGPNEAGENLKLSAVIEEQLKNSSIILIVLDFTQLNNKAADDIKRQVKPIIDLLGKENLYVLVNKVDQRTANDPMTVDKVKQFVLADLELGNNQDIDRVFEVAARWAFCATNFLSEFQKNPDAELIQLLTARPLAEQVFGIDWEEDLEDSSLDELEKKAKRLWKKSGFQSFLDHSINALMERAAPLAMKSALNYCRGLLNELKNDVSLRSSAISEDGEKLCNEIQALEADLERLKVCRIKLKEVERVRFDLQKSLDKTLENAREDSLVNLKEFFAKEELEKADSLKQLDIEVRHFLLKPINPLPLFPDFIAKIFRDLEFKPSGEFEFSTEAEAKSFANQSILYVKQKYEIILSKCKNIIGREIDKTRRDLNDLLDQETKPIIDQAKARLNQNFNVDLSLPTLSFDSDRINFTNPRVKNSSRTVDQGYETVRVKKRDFWNWLWMVEFEVDEKRKKPDCKENCYVISLEELIPEINQSIENSIDALRLGINKYLDEDFQEKVNFFFDNLDTYLGSYRDSLRQAQSDQQLLKEEKDRLVNELNIIVPDATDYMKGCSLYLDSIEHLLAQHK